MTSAPPTSIPEGLDVFNEADGVIVRRRWFSWMFIPLAIFAVVWDSFLVFWYSVAFHNPHAPLIMKLFPLGHVAVGVFITYSVFTTLFNRTDVQVLTSGVRAIVGPLPWPGNKQVPVSDLRDVVIRTRTSNRSSMTYSVMYVGADQRERKLVTSIPQLEQAEFIAATIRQRLGLRPPVDS